MLLKTSGSFSPALEPDWKGIAYHGPPATFVPVRENKKHARGRKQPLAKRAGRKLAAPKSFAKPSQTFTTAPTGPSTRTLILPTTAITPSAGSLQGFFSCSVCSMTFNSQNLLRKHVRDTGHFDTSVSNNQVVNPPIPQTTPSTFYVPATKTTAPVVQKKESVEMFNPPAVDPFVNDLSAFGLQPGSSSPSSFSYGQYATPPVRDTSSVPPSYGSPYRPSSHAATTSTAYTTTSHSTSSQPQQYDDMNTAARALYLISRCFKEGHISENDRRKLKELFIKGSEIITAAVEVYDIDRDLNELFDTLKRVAQSS